MLSSFELIKKNERIYLLLIELSMLSVSFGGPILR